MDFCSQSSFLSDLLFSLSRRDREVRHPFVSDYQTDIVLVPGVNRVASDDPVLRPLSPQLERLTQLCSFPFSSPCSSSCRHSGHFWMICSPSQNDTPIQSILFNIKRRKAGSREETSFMVKLSNFPSTSPISALTLQSSPDRFPAHHCYWSYWSYWTRFSASLPSSPVILSASLCSRQPDSSRLSRL